jgi:hypothetical protein
VLLLGSNILFILGCVKLFGGLFKWEIIVVRKGYKTEADKVESDCG